MSTKKTKLRGKQMNIDITIGSIVYGAANIGCKVLEIDGDTLTIETSDGAGLIPFSRVVRVEPPPLVDRLRTISTLDKLEAIASLHDLLSEFSTDSIYETSLDIDTYSGVFIRRLLADINPLEFEEIGKDGSEGKYGVLTFPELPPPIS
jgi:hypothetical protein